MIHFYTARGKCRHLPAPCPQNREMERGKKTKPTKPLKETNPNPRRMLPRAQATALQSGTKLQTESCFSTGPALWDSHRLWCSLFLALVTCSPFGTSTKSPRAQLGRNTGPTARWGQDPRPPVPELCSQRETCKRACSRRRRWAARRGPAAPGPWGRQALPLRAGPKRRVNMSASSPSLGEGRQRACLVRAVPGAGSPCQAHGTSVTQPFCPPTLSPLNWGRSRAAVASLGAWRTAARVLSCKHVRLGCSKKLWQRGSKAVRNVLSRSLESTTGAAEQRHSARRVKGSVPAPRAGCPWPQAGVGTEQGRLAAGPVGARGQAPGRAEKPTGRPIIPERVNCCLSPSPKIQDTVSWGPQSAREHRDVCVRTESLQGTS